MGVGSNLGQVSATSFIGRTSAKFDGLVDIKLTLASELAN